MSLTNRAAAALDGLKAHWRRGLELNTNERLALTQLWEGGPMTIGDLGDRLTLSRAAMTALVDRLQAMGYVARHRDAADRRRMIIRVTDKPYERLAPLALPFHEGLVRHAATLDDQAWEAVVGFLDHMYETCVVERERLASLDTDEIVAQANEPVVSTGSSAGRGFPFPTPASRTQSG